MTPPSLLFPQPRVIDIAGPPLALRIGAGVVGFRHFPRNMGREWRATSPSRLNCQCPVSLRAVNQRPQSNENSNSLRQVAHNIEIVVQQLVITSTIFTWALANQYSPVCGYRVINGAHQILIVDQVSQPFLRYHQLHLCYSTQKEETRQPFEKNPGAVRR